MSEGHPRYDVVIGLEVHAQLCTESKLFSPAPVAYGEPANHCVHPICLGLPGVLPVLNARAVEFAILAGLATHCTVQLHSVFARKNYFYPDLPKGYQISQYEEPICTEGWIDVVVEPGAAPRRIRLTRIHMEEDAGKLIHEAGAAGSDGTRVDLNRAGVPLLEIVSEPDLRSPSEAAAYLRTLRGILRYIGVSDADLEKGHFRCDANVSLKPRGTAELGTRTELKNLNSFRFVEEAISAEIARQAELHDEGTPVQQATMAYDPHTSRTRVLRLKENADDYRYFPDPDLVPLAISAEQIETARASLPELADAKCARFQSQYALTAQDAEQLTESRPLADYFEAAVAAYGLAKPVANWLLRDVLQALGELELGIEAARLAPESLAALIRLVDAGSTNAKSARGLVKELVANGGDPAALVHERGLEALSDSGELEAAVEAVLGEHPDDAEKFRAGEKKVLNFLMGQVMRRTAGKADPKAVRELLARKLGA
ncbi:MAG: Asp-tRNA(Asn)/Glu-tRNA(Gln) amidotransferase subunit GatB [Deltaproteobacteria bacterium]|nr:Asp-tRNA(Asn)/Glu-tRNA(Gln) amidotransferase subunit GatB [Deltaproteobacteria bacterium]